MIKSADREGNFNGRINCGMKIPVQVELGWGTRRRSELKRIINDIYNIIPKINQTRNKRLNWSTTGISKRKLRNDLALTLNLYATWAEVSSEREILKASIAALCSTVTFLSPVVQTITNREAYQWCRSFRLPKEIRSLISKFRTVEIVHSNWQRQDL